MNIQPVHCDERVLHGPKANCKYCNQHPEWQALREMWGINFTGEHDPDKLTCPAEQKRSLKTINRWGGNVPYTPERELDLANERLRWQPEPRLGPQPESEEQAIERARVLGEIIRWAKKKLEEARKCKRACKLCGVGESSIWSYTSDGYFCSYEHYGQWSKTPEGRQAYLDSVVDKK